VLVEAAASVNVNEAWPSELVTTTWFTVEVLRPDTDHVTEAFGTTAPNWFLTVATIATEPSGARRTPDAGVNATVVEVIAGK
jgi:hypothetical protein